LVVSRFSISVRECTVAKVYVIAELCPMPCLMPVIFVKCRAGGRVFAWCAACGCAWADPAKESWQRGDLGDCSHPCLIAEGEIELPARESIERSGLGYMIVSEQEADTWWLEQIANYNCEHGHHRRKPSAQANRPHE
jgi:hypothetical protein